MRLNIKTITLQEHNSAPVFRPLCQTCGKDFVNNTALKYHIQRNHMGKREVYMCEICGKFSSTVNPHMNELKAKVSSSLLHLFS